MSMARQDGKLCFIDLELGNSVTSNSVSWFNFVM
jgi:hypothetical protein